MRSYHFPVKAIFIGCVGRPVTDRGFDGRTHIERVSKTVVVSKLTAHPKFTYDVLVNLQIKGGSWQDLHYEGIIVDKM